MDIQLGKITVKGQTTIPAIFRKELALASGDEIVFERTGQTITIRKVKPIDVAYYKAVQTSFATEWDSQADNEAYNDL